LIEIEGHSERIWDSRSEVWAALRDGFRRTVEVLGQYNITLSDLQVTSWQATCAYTSGSTCANFDYYTRTDAIDSSMVCKFYIKIAWYPSSSAEMISVYDSISGGALDTAMADECRDEGLERDDIDGLGFGDTLSIALTFTGYDENNAQIISSSFGSSNGALIQSVSWVVVAISLCLALFAH